LLAVLSGTKIPLAWRELLYVLTWDDIDLDDERIRITKAWDYEAKEVKSTKTEETRAIPIGPNLLPLLRRMKLCAGRTVAVTAPAASKPNRVPLALAADGAEQRRATSSVPLVRRGDHMEHHARRRRREGAAPRGAQAHRDDDELHRRSPEPRRDVRGAVPSVAALHARAAA
jgi:integrase